MTTSISRSVYQKVVEENKRLLNDIAILVDPNSVSKQAVKKKHRIRLTELDKQANLFRAMFNQPLIDEMRWLKKKRL